MRAKRQVRNSKITFPSVVSSYKDSRPTRHRQCLLSVKFRQVSQALRNGGSRRAGVLHAGGSRTYWVG